MELPFVDLVAFLADYVPAASARPPTLVICTEACAGDVERDLAARTRAVA
jgi:hypothetical protein